MRRDRATRDSSGSMGRSDFTPGSVAGAILLMMLVALVGAGWAIAPDPGRLTNNGLPPDWSCRSVSGTSALTCVKRPAGRSNPG